MQYGQYFWIDDRQEDRKIDRQKDRKKECDYLWEKNWRSKCLEEDTLS